MFADNVRHLYTIQKINLNQIVVGQVLMMKYLEQLKDCLIKMGEEQKYCAIVAMRIAVDTVTLAASIEAPDITGATANVHTAANV